MKYCNFLFILTLLFITGCATIGPDSVPRDRFDYNTAIADSWKEQTLLNIVKLRYADMPLFVEVASVVSGYTLESTVNLGGTLSSKDAVQGDFFSLGTSGKYIDRPTITYAPITGTKFNQSFMTPIPPKMIFFLLESGWPTEMVFPIVVDAINGLRSRTAAGMHARKGDPGFYRAIALFQQIQDSGNSSMRILKGEDQEETTVIFIHRNQLRPGNTETIKELETLLGLAPDTNKLNVTYGVIPESDRELAMQTRSMLQIMIELATQIDVPQEHIEDGRTIPTLIPPDSSEKAVVQHVRVHSSPNPPEYAFVSVNYKEHWFWIDDRDFHSKRAFTFLMILFSLTETGGKGDLPLVTIPAG